MYCLVEREQRHVYVSEACLKGRKELVQSKEHNRTTGNEPSILVVHVAGSKRQFCQTKIPVRQFSAKQGCCLLLSTRCFGSPTGYSSSQPDHHPCVKAPPYDKLLITASRSTLNAIISTEACELYQVSVQHPEVHQERLTFLCCQTQIFPE